MKKWVCEECDPACVLIVDDEDVNVHPSNCPWSGVAKWEEVKE